MIEKGSSHKISVDDFPDAKSADLILVVEESTGGRQFQALAELSTRSERPVHMTKMLLELMQSDDAELRSMALWHFSQYREIPKKAIPKIIEALADEDADVRQQAACTLGVDERHAKKAVPALEKAAVCDDDKLVKEAANWALRQFGIQKLNETEVRARHAGVADFQVPAERSLQSSSAMYRNILPICTFALGITFRAGKWMLYDMPMALLRSLSSGKSKSLSAQKKR